MGQQQLLLLVLGVVIVGVAVVIAITAFSEGAVQSNSDALMQDALRIASDAQSWKAKPELLGGSADATKAESANFDGVNFAMLGYSAEKTFEDGECYRNENGEYALFGSDSGLGVLATSVSKQNMVGLEVTGVGGTDIRLYQADWNPIKGGARPDGSSRRVRSHKRCRGPGETPMDVGLGN